MDSHKTIATDNGPLKCELKGDTITVNDDLVISFRRTIRVPDNHETSFLPPDLGTFPLKSVTTYAENMCASMTAKSGVFFPMYQSEAMWIDFECNKDKTRQYMIKIYAGGINVISGEHANEDLGTRLRRRAKLARRYDDISINGLLQDYIIVPAQRWLDGIANFNGTVRQFVAMPFGSGYSIESQITGKDAAGGLQFEITPSRPRWVPSPYPPHELTGPRPVYTDGNLMVFVRDLYGKPHTIHCHEHESVEITKCRIQDKIGMPPSQMRLTDGKKWLQSGHTLDDYNVSYGSTMHLVLKLRGGGGGLPVHEMSVAAGGKVHQVISKDSFDKAHWLPTRTIVFNVQILNSFVYQAVTGEAPPTKPMNAEVYASHGLPFYKMFEEPSGIRGDFDMVKSVTKLDHSSDSVVMPKVVTISRSELTNIKGPLRPFRTVRDLEKEFSGVHVASF